MSCALVGVVDVVGVDEVLFAAAREPQSMTAARDLALSDKIYAAPHSSVIQ